MSRDSGRLAGPDGDDRVVIRQRRTTGQPIGSVRHDVHSETIRRPGHDTEVEVPEQLNWQGDQVRWGPIVAGLLTAVSTLALLGLLGAALGFTGLDAGYDAAVRGAPPPDAGRNAAFWAAVSGMIAFLLGGFVAGKTAGVFDRKWGALNGAMVFLFALPLTIWLASMGIGALLGSAGNFAAGLGANVEAARTATDAARGAATNVTPGDVARAAETARNAAWWALGGSLLALGAATLGGWLGTRREIEIDEPSTDGKPLATGTTSGTTRRTGTIMH